VAKYARRFFGRLGPRPVPGPMEHRGHGQHIGGSLLGSPIELNAYDPYGPYTPPIEAGENAVLKA
jgi:hypothetical protein